MKEVFDEVVEVLSRGERAALSTIVSSKGSLPMSKKAKMLVKSDGTFTGTVGGGCLEADVWAEAAGGDGKVFAPVAAFHSDREARRRRGPELRR